MLALLLIAFFLILPYDGDATASFQCFIITRKLPSKSNLKLFSCVFRPSFLQTITCSCIEIYPALQPLPICRALSLHYFVVQRPHDLSVYPPQAFWTPDNPQATKQKFNQLWEQQILTLLGATTAPCCIWQEPGAQLGAQPSSSAGTGEGTVHHGPQLQPTSFGTHGRISYGVSMQTLVKEVGLAMGRSLQVMQSMEPSCGVLVNGIISRY